MSAQATSITHYLFEAAPLWTGTIGAGGVADDSITTIPLQSASGLTDGNAYIVRINRVDSGGTKQSPNLTEVAIGELSGTNLINCIRGQEGVAQAFNAGVVVEILFTASHWNKLVDFLGIEHNADGTHSDITADSIAIPATDVNFGWLNVTDTWAYASATTITVPSGAASLYQKGDKLRFKQGGGYKYYYIVGVADTVLTVTGGSDFTVANSAITDIAISRASNPFGFPHWFNWTPTFTGFSTNPTGVHRFSVIGDQCTVIIRHVGIGTSNATGFTVLAPIPCATVTNLTISTGVLATDNNATLTSPSMIVISSAGTSFVMEKSWGSGAASWTNTSGKRIINTPAFAYPI
jgi:hypothetical protein